MQSQLIRGNLTFFPLLGTKTYLATFTRDILFKQKPRGHEELQKPRDSNGTDTKQSRLGANLRVEVTAHHTGLNR